MKNEKTKRIIASVIAILLCLGIFVGILFSAFYSIL